jgi:sugar/nucleoside kinase (ribokinase family)
MTGTPGVLCCGNIVFDTLVRPAPNETHWHTSLWVDSIEQQIGGNGANTAIAIARLGVPARLAGRVGKDANGERVLAILRTSGVDISFVDQAEDPTSASVALVRADGARALLHCPGVSRSVFNPPPALEGPLSAGCRFLHIGNPFGVPGLRANGPAMLKQAHELGLRTSIDGGWDSRGEWLRALAPSLAETDLLFVNHDEARELTGHTDPVRQAEILQQAGASAVVIKWGAEGCAVFENTRQFHSPGFPVEVRDTTGAGDCFAGGFLAGLARGMDFPDAARLANAVGARSVTAVGSITGLLGFEETLAWARALQEQPRL